MKLTDFLTEGNNVAALEAELKELNRELMNAKAGGNDDMIDQFKEDIVEVKEKIKDAQS